MLWNDLAVAAICPQGALSVSKQCPSLEVKTLADAGDIAVHLELVGASLRGSRFVDCLHVPDMKVAAS